MLVQKRYPSERQWHPILACEEYEPGRWIMVAQYGHPYAHIMIVRHGDEVGYRVDTWAETIEARSLIGYFRNLRAAARAGHVEFLAGHSTRGARGDYAAQPAYGGDTRQTAKANTPDRVERD